MIRGLYLQHLYQLSDPQLEDQLSFRRELAAICWNIERSISRAKSGSPLLPAAAKNNGWDYDNRRFVHFLEL